MYVSVKDLVRVSYIYEVLIRARHIGKDVTSKSKMSEMVGS